MDNTSNFLSRPFCDLLLLCASDGSSFPGSDEDEAACREVIGGGQIVKSVTEARTAFKLCHNAM